MKRILALFSALTLVFFCLTGCQSQTTDTAEEAETGTEKLSVITTIFPQYDFVREIGGEYVAASMLLQPGTESHSYDPTPQDIIAIQNCDLFIYTGGENDVWVDEILATMGEDAPQTLKLLDCVDTVEEEIVEGMEHVHEDEDDHDHEDEAETDDHDHDHEDEAETDDHDHDHEDEAETDDHDHDHEDEAEADDHDHDHEDGEVDEHVWTSPKNAIEIVTVITNLLTEMDSANGATFQANSAAYIAQLEELDQAFQTVVDEGARNVILFGDRFPFRYFADDYGLEYYAAFTGCSTETEASAATVAFLIEKVKELELPVVFTIELSTGKIADAICESTEAVNLTFHSAHNITKDEMEAGDTYLSIMWDNVDALRTALN